MKLMNITLGDGRTVTVDADRFASFQHLVKNVLGVDQAFMAGLAGLDAGEAMSFLVSQLAYTEAQVFERLYTPMQYEQLVPISYAAGEWADSIRYEIYDYVGRGKRSGGRGDNINLVSVAYADKTLPVVSGDIGYDYTTEELRRSIYLRKSVDDTKLAAAMDGYRRHMNDVALNGEVESSFTGLFNSATVPQGNAPTGNWATATEAQILADLNQLILNIWTNTAFNDMPDTIAMAPTSFNLIATKPRSSNSDKTILSYLLENNLVRVQTGRSLTIVPGYGLDTAGSGSTKRMLGYVKRPDRVVFHHPMPLRFLSPQLQNLRVVVPGEYKYGQTHFRYPKSAYYMDNL